MDNPKHLLRGELALVIAVFINSFGVVLMLYSGSGISAISSVPYAFTVVFPFLTLGTWTYIFQGTLVIILFIMRRKIVVQYLLSFVVGFFFGILIDFHEAWINILPYTIPLRVIYFILSYILISIGIALSNRCKMPIIPTDLFPREFSAITKISYPKVKISFDCLCLIITLFMTLFATGHIEGLGIGTILAAVTMGKAIGLVGNFIDAKGFEFISIFSKAKTLN